MASERRIRLARVLTVLFMIGLILSGLTAMPLQTQLDFVTRFLTHESALGAWMWRVRDAVAQINRDAPFIFYGDDWLAFGHIAIALAFVPAVRDPVNHRWLFDYGLILCGLVIVWALSVGPFRGIPLGWRLIDCSFGLFGAIPLWIARRAVRSEIISVSSPTATPTPLADSAARS